MLSLPECLSRPLPLDVHFRTNFRLLTLLESLCFHKYSIAESIGALTFPKETFFLGINYLKFLLPTSPNCHITESATQWLALQQTL